MLGVGLAPEEVAKRLVRLNNLERLHGEQKTRIENLVAENKTLRGRVSALEAENKALRSSVEDLKLQLEELKAIVFGKKKPQKQEPYDDDFPPTPTACDKPRTKESYRRKLPKEDEVIETKPHPIDRCADCGGEFAERETKTYYEEDIPLPQKKTVVRHVVEKGRCARCGTWSAGVPLPTAPVVLGPNVRRYVPYLSIVCRQSYSQIEDLLKQTYDFDVSQGEIWNIMEKEGNRLRPEYERLKANIRGEPSVHLDESGWKLLANGTKGFAWTMVGGKSAGAVFMLGKTRGKGNAQELLGDSKAVIVSDDYAAYRNLENEHQLCCAHILRKLRDLARSKEIAEPVRAHCRVAYETFAAIYAAIETARQSACPAAARDALLEQLRKFAAPNPADPAKLRRVRTQVRERTELYLTCLLHSDVAADNNAAERSLRHLVIKRKTSFGSLTERTAEIVAILCSVLLSCRTRGTLRNYLAGA